MRKFDGVSVGGGKSAPASKFSNARAGCFNNSGKDAKTMREWIQCRYDEKIKFFNDYYVSLIRR